MDAPVTTESRAQIRFRAMRASFDAAQRQLATGGALPEPVVDSVGERDFRLPANPYPGLRSFTPQEGSFFFGRERSVNGIRGRLANSNVAVVLGGSGSGKSSVVRAGLIPRLNSTMGIRGRSGNWYSAEFRPRLRPLEELAAALADLVDREFPEQGPDATGSAGACNREALLARLRDDFQIARGTTQTSLRALREARASALCDALFNFVEAELDCRDRAATKGLRSGKPSLLLVIDQFEEIFRPEVIDDRTSGGDDLLDMLLAAYARLEREHKVNPDVRSGLFIVITMRSEELHRCTEYPSLPVLTGPHAVHHSLADMVNGSAYLLDLLDPVEARNDLREAIVRPARRVFEDWGMPLDDGNQDAPFAQGVADWLLDGVVQLSVELDHRPDELPLLQHALQAIWSGAMDDWQAGSQGGQADFVIRQAHLECAIRLPAQGTPAESGADLTTCLDKRADVTARHAQERFASEVARLRGQPKAKADTEDGWHKAGLAAIRAAFRALARRDDRGNWARRFATTRQIVAFARGDAATHELSLAQLERGIEAALQEFVSRGYIVCKDGQYDNSHEALIRNWRRYQEWLREPDEISQALTRAVTDLEPARANSANAEEADEYLVSTLSVSTDRTLAPVVTERVFPEDWAVDQIVPLLKKPAAARRWAAFKPPAPQGDSEDDRSFAACILAELRSLMKRAQLARERIARERERELRKGRILKLWGIGATVGVLLVGAAVAAVYEYSRGRAQVEKLLAAEQESSSAYRLRTLLLLSAMSESGGIFGSLLPRDRARRALANVLTNTPVFVEKVDAVGVSSDGTRLALLQGNTLVDYNLTNGKEVRLAVNWPREDTYGPAPEHFRPGSDRTVAGYIKGPTGDIPALYNDSDGIVLYRHEQQWRAFDVRHLFPGEFPSGRWLRNPEVANGAVRIVTAVRSGGRRSSDIRDTRVLELRHTSEGAAAGELQLKAFADTPIRSGEFGPTIPGDCQFYAYVENATLGKEVRQTIQIGRIRSQDEPGVLDRLPALTADEAEASLSGSGFTRSLAFSSICDAIVVREERGKVRVLRVREVDRQLPSGEVARQLELAGDPISVSLSEGLSESLQEWVRPSSFGRRRPLLSAARVKDEVEGDIWRFAWLVPGGVSLIERGQPGSPTANPRLLTGSESLDKAANLSFSDDGRFLILVLPTQAGRSSSVQVKVWDLERGPSIKALSDAQLRELACETAKHETGNAALMDHEMKWWEVSQPCGDP